MALRWLHCEQSIACTVQQNKYLPLLRATSAALLGPSQCCIPTGKKVYQQLFVTNRLHHACRQGASSTTNKSALPPPPVVLSLCMRGTGRGPWKASCPVRITITPLAYCASCATLFWCARACCCRARLFVGCVWGGQGGSASLGPWVGPRSVGLVVGVRQFLSSRRRGHRVMHA